MLKRGRVIAALMSVAALAVAVAVTTSTAAPTASAAQADIAAAKAIIAKYSKEPKFVAPGPAFNAKQVMRGKKVMIIPVTSQIPITQVLTASMAREAKRVGFTFTNWQNQGKADQWIQGIQQAISQRYDVVDLLAIPPAVLKPQIDQARKAGVKVISSHFAGFGWQPPKYIDGAVRLPYFEVGQILAAWAVVQTNGKANVLSIVANDLVSSADVIKGMRSVFSRDCKGCKLDIVDVPTVEWANKVQGEVQSGLQRNPNVNYVLPIYDAMTSFVSAALRVSGKAGKVQQASFNGTPFVLEAVKKGDVQMDIGENEDWIARAMLDADMRAAGDLKVPTSHYRGAPLYIFTKKNVAKAGTPPHPAKGYGSAYRTGFDKLWKLG
ncbi:MAG: ribose transport system substrate-binding protein [Gaiellaceae bacterium]|nr:ribose transport system substrate-binding protein [Gaiellaceae bacterium]